MLKQRVVVTTFFLIFGTLVSNVNADIASDVWTTGVANPNNGAFGTPGSITGNNLAATITTGASVANVNLSANNGSWFRTTGSPNITNDQLAPFLENDVPLTSVTFTSDVPLYNFDMLVHNVWHSQNGDTNYIGNFEVTYENGTVVSNALPQLRQIHVDSPFDVDFAGGTIQPTGINGVFDDNNLLTLTGPAFNPGNAAGLGYYLYDGTHSTMSEKQGSGIVSFDESINGGIRSVSFDWVGNTIGTNTAFIGFAGSTSSAVPEPAAGFIVLAFSAIVGLRRRGRDSSSI